MVKGADQSAFAVHRKIARGPDGGGADIGSKDRVLGCESIFRSRRRLSLKPFRLSPVTPHMRSTPAFARVFATRVFATRVFANRSAIVIFAILPSK